ncbi:HTTM domain-containing protein [Maribacter sp. 1_2014MBL_MicDiv]|uniref:HTTM domain-containing protein n=1 Tax=Maribacter sp. 1_2014MBL_MicDiv TaxID=1644130 RepID=UPI0008F5480D|nr:HTTM domain-containing protein [Maribacter sp. 1_2014MBL_MicDiv]APA64650.1 HTTM domain-containing protein [Maribacter sp. 1_2014MBL_MicDiv]
MLNRLLFQRIDNSSLIIFRIFFGILISLECFGAIATGWVNRNLIAPKFKFPFIDFDFLQPLPGNGMYFYFGIMGLMGICIALGFKYRASMITFTTMWTATYLMQKTAYNNHYYLLILISLIMCFFPAERSRSIDVKLNTKIESNAMYAYIKWIVVLQLFIVYTYASIAKIYGDWLDFSTIAVLMHSKRNYWLVGDILQEPWIHTVIGSAGILFDLLIVPALLWKPTRKAAFFLSLFFHLFNSIIFQIGIFPYLSIAFSVFFFEPETIRKIFFKSKIPFTTSKVIIPNYKNSFLIVAAVYFLTQLLLPVRHYTFEDDVLWTEEGHRMSWRMMLRSRQGKGRYKVVDKNTEEVFIINPKDYVSRSQERKIFAYPDFAWQFAQYLKKEFKEENRDVSVYLENSKISINRKPYEPFIDSKTDLAAETWYRTKHHSWILPSPYIKSEK